MSQVARISCFVHSALLPTLLSRLTESGIQNLYVDSGRMAILDDPRGIQALFKSAGLTSQPVDALHFFVPADEEDWAVALVVKTCRLDIPGRGSVYSELLDVLAGDSSTSINRELKTAGIDARKVLTFEDLVYQGCIVPRGEADTLVRHLLQLGIVPTVTHGVGTGIRDRLGLLRITLPREKDIISIVVGESEAGFVTEQIIIGARLDQPGRGFVFQVPIRRGVINFKTSNQAVGHAASIDQIVAAVDSLKGSFSWRQGNTGLSRVVRRHYMSGSALTLYIRDGFSHTLAQQVMKLGISGATVLSPKVLRHSTGPSDRIHSAREICQLMIPDQLVQPVVQICSDMGLLADDEHAILVRGSSPRAYTYQRRSHATMQKTAAAKTHPT